MITITIMKSCKPPDASPGTKFVSTPENGALFRGMFRQYIALFAFLGYCYTFLSTCKLVTIGIVDQETSNLLQTDTFEILPAFVSDS